MKTKRIEYLDFLRALACISVVIYHIKMPDNVSENIISLLFNFCVPIFLMISGGLYLNKPYELTLSDIIKKYVLKLLGTIFIFGFIYNFISLTIINRTINFKIILNSVWMIIKADTTFCYQFWYLYMLIGLMLFLPIIKSWTDKIREKKTPSVELNLMCLVFLTVSVIIPYVLNFFDIKQFWCGGFTVFYAFLFYMICGFYFSKYDISKTIFNIGFIVLILLLSYIIYIYIFKDTLPEKYTGYSSFPTFLLSVILFIIFKNIKYNKINQKFKNFINFIANNSLGIYVYHVLFITLFQKGLEFAHININSVAVTLSQFAFAFILSIISTLITKKIPFVKNYI